MSLAFELLQRAVVFTICLVPFGASRFYDETREVLEGQLHHTTVLEAGCSSEHDKTRILSAIVGTEADIDQAIAVLVKAGEFNTALLSLQRSGVPLGSLRSNPAATFVPVLCGLVYIMSVPAGMLDVLGTLLGDDVLKSKVTWMHTALVLLFFTLCSPWLCRLCAAHAAKNWRVGRQMRRLDNLMRFLCAWCLCAMMVSCFDVCPAAELSAPECLPRGWILTCCTSSVVTWVGFFVFCLSAGCCECFWFGGHLGMLAWCLALLSPLPVLFRLFLQLPADVAISRAFSAAGFPCDGKVLRVAGASFSILLCVGPYVYAFQALRGLHQAQVTAFRRLVRASGLSCFCLQSMQLVALWPSFGYTRQMEMNMWLVATAPLLNWLVLPFVLPPVLLPQAPLAPLAAVRASGDRCVHEHAAGDALELGIVSRTPLLAGSSF